MDPNEHASTVLTLITLALLGIGTLAMIYRGIRQWLINRQTSAGDMAAQLVDDVKRGEGFTFHKSIMSSDRAEDSSSPVAASQVRHQAPAPVSVSAEPNTDDTSRVSGASGASQLDTSARDIMRASVIAELLDSGLLTNRDKAICQIFRCSKASSSRPDAPFQVALRLVEQHRAKRKTEYVGDMIARVEREVAEQH